MINALQKSDNDQTCRTEFMKASERLGRVLNEADIRLLIGSVIQKNGANRAEKDGNWETNMSFKQMEKNKREVEKQKKRLDIEVQKEKLQHEKELKRLQDEAEKEEKRREKEEKRREKEEAELRKQLKRQQEEAERDQRRREKEEAESRKQLALQKQATLMECFLKKSKNSSPSQKDPSPAKIECTDLSFNRRAQMFESVTLSMDSALSQHDGIERENLWK